MFTSSRPVLTDLLPAEILQSICEAAHALFLADILASSSSCPKCLYTYPSDEWKKNPVVSLSHTSSAFRTAALRTPTLWTTLSTCQSLPEIDTYLQRSLDCRLYISLHLKYDVGADDLSTQRRPNKKLASSSTLESFLDRLAPLAPIRWHALSIDLGADEDLRDITSVLDLSICCFQFLFHVTCAVRNLGTLPYLSHLVLNYPASHFPSASSALETEYATGELIDELAADVSEDERPYTTRYHRYTEFDFPNLKTLQTRYIIPSTRFISTTHHLTSLSLNLALPNDYPDDELLDYPDNQLFEDRTLFPLLSDPHLGSSLQHLNLHISSNVHFANRLPVELSNLKSFTFHVEVRTRWVVLRRKWRMFSSRMWRRSRYMLLPMFMNGVLESIASRGGFGISFIQTTLSTPTLYIWPLLSDRPKEWRAV